MSMPFPNNVMGYSPMQMPQQPMYSYQPQTYQPQIQRPQATPATMAGPTGPSVRLIANESDINVADIPMDGQVHLFMLNDFSQIIGKMWTAQGEIATTIFVPMQPEPAKPEPTPSVDRDWMEARFEKLENMILESSTNPEG